MTLYRTLLATSRKTGAARCWCRRTLSKAPTKSLAPTISRTVPDARTAARSLPCSTSRSTVALVAPLTESLVIRTKRPVCDRTLRA